MTTKSLSERLVKVEVEVCNLQEDLKEQLVALNQHLDDMKRVSNDEHTKIYSLIDKQQQQIDKILSNCMAHQLDSEKIKLTNKVLYIIAGAITIGIVTLFFDVIKKLAGL